MKKAVHLILLLFFTSPTMAQFQFNYGAEEEHYHDLNIDRIKDGSNDLILAGNLFDSTMTDETMVLQRITENGTVVWAHKYLDSNLLKARCFDVVSDENFIYATGSVDVSGVKKVFIARIDPSNGNVLASNYYEVGGDMHHGWGLKVSVTNSDATGDGVPNPGLVVAGFYSACYEVSHQCSENTGFVLRTDSGLDDLWTVGIESGITGIWDFDMANGLTETIDGFVVTGSATGDAFGFIRQSVLVCKIDFEGSLLWNESYRSGNSRDVSTDAYYDADDDAVFVLCNYSNAHYFGVTVFNNTSGAVDLSRSWRSYNPDGLDCYGFTIHEAPGNLDNLLLAAYERSLNWTDTLGSEVLSESSVIIYEFDKSSGDQVGLSYQYLVPHEENMGDEFNFWNGQMPLIYYPDISYAYNDEQQKTNCIQVGYRTESSGFTKAELYRTVDIKRNECDHLLMNFLHDDIVRQAAPIDVFIASSNLFSMGLAAQSFTPFKSACDMSVNTMNAPVKAPIRLYPNPAYNEIHLESQNTLRSYQIVSSLGKPLMSGLINQNRVSLDVGHFPPGLYFIWVETDDEKATVMRFVKTSGR